MGWTSIYQLFWCSPGVQGFDTLPYGKMRWTPWDEMGMVPWWQCRLIRNFGILWLSKGVSRHCAAGSSLWDRFWFLLQTWALPNNSILKPNIIKYHHISSHITCCPMWSNIWSKIIKPVEPKSFQPAADDLPGGQSRLQGPRVATGAGGAVSSAGNWRSKCLQIWINLAIVLLRLDLKDIFVPIKIKNFWKFFRVVSREFKWEKNVLIMLDTCWINLWIPCELPAMIAMDHEAFGAGAILSSSHWIGGQGSTRAPLAPVVDAYLKCASKKARDF